MSELPSPDGFDSWTVAGDLEDDSRLNGKWSISWSDLMMTMFVMFTVLFVYQSGNRDLKFGKGPGVNELGDDGSGSIAEVTLDQSPSGLYDQTRQAVMDEFASGNVTVDMVDEQAVRITIAGDILFDVGNAVLRPQAKERLRQIAAIVNESRYAVNVVGHTDSMPNHSEQYPTNWELSADRAVRTARFLMETAGVDPARVYISAHAWHKPVRPNTTRANRKLNRRVEIILVKQRF